MALHVGRDFIESKNLRRCSGLFRREANREVTGWNEPITSQTLANTGRDLFVYGDAARNRDNRQAALLCDPVVRIMTLPLSC